MILHISKDRHIKFVTIQYYIECGGKCNIHGTTSVTSHLIKWQTSQRTVTLTSHLRFLDVWKLKEVFQKILIPKSVVTEMYSWLTVTYTGLTCAYHARVQNLTLTRVNTNRVTIFCDCTRPQYFVIQECSSVLGHQLYDSWSHILFYHATTDCSCQDWIFIPTLCIIVDERIYETL